MVADLHQDPLDFDHYMDANRIPLERAGEAFAEYLRREHDWRGSIRRIDFPLGD